MFLYEIDEINETPYFTENYDKTTIKAKLYKIIIYKMLHTGIKIISMKLILILINVNI